MHMRKMGDYPLSELSAWHGSNMTDTMSERRATHRKCLRPGCDALVPVHRLMCRGHWRRLPPILRDSLLAKIDPTREDPIGSMAFGNALAACVRYLDIRERHERGRG
jgi:hypothetical protein